MITLFLNITPLMWKRFIVFEFPPTIIHEKNFACVESSKFSMLVDHEKNALCDGYIVEFILDATENYYEGGTYTCRNCNNIKSLCA